jgi:riboflavin synthase
MFTGLIRHTGLLAARSAHQFRVACPGLRPELHPGDSVAVNGACLTVAELERDAFSADLLEETWVATTLGSLAPGRRLNLELPLTAESRLDGHFVQGHVDGTVRVLELHREVEQWRLRLELPAWLEPLVHPTASIALDGVSLTVQSLDSSSFSVALIPTTYNETAFGDISPGVLVNVEADMLVKAVHRILGLQQGNARITLERLKELGFGR